MSWKFRVILLGCVCVCVCVCACALGLLKVAEFVQLRLNEEVIFKENIRQTSRLDVFDSSYKIMNMV